MTALLRPFVTAFLCGVIAFGQLPAWLHVASCGSHSHPDQSQHCDSQLGDVSELPDISSHCETGCSHHSPGAHLSPAQAKAQQPAHDAIRTLAGCNHSPHHENGPSEHDSDDCKICQSLYGPAGVVQFEIVVLSEVGAGEAIGMVASALVAQVTCSIAQPRGPPRTV